MGIVTPKFEVPENEYNLNHSLKIADVEKDQSFIKPRLYLDSMIIPVVGL
jgi:hypothetical protein